MIISFANYKKFKALLKEHLTVESGLNGVVYKLFTQKDQKRIKVGRVGGADENGILYIGQTTNPIDRLALLFRSFQHAPPEGKLWRHGAEEIYWQCEVVKKKYPIENMMLEIIPCEDTKAFEEEEIRKYYKLFGEVPPFNGAIVKRKSIKK